MGRITAEIAQGTYHPALDSYSLTNQRNTVSETSREKIRRPSFNRTPYTAAVPVLPGRPGRQELQINITELALMHQSWRVGCTVGLPLNSERSCQSAVIH